MPYITDEVIIAVLPKLKALSLKLAKGNRAVAEDIVQDTIYRILKKRKDVDNPEGFIISTMFYISKEHSNAFYRREEINKEYSYLNKPLNVDIFNKTYSNEIIVALQSAKLTEQQQSIMIGTCLQLETAEIQEQSKSKNTAVVKAIRNQIRNKHFRHLQ